MSVALGKERKYLLLLQQFRTIVKSLQKYINGE